MAISTGLRAENISQGKLTQVESYLKQMQEVFPTFRSGIFVLDKEGKLLVDYPSHPKLRGQSFAFREYFQRTMREQKGVVSSPYRSARMESPVLTFTAPVRDSQNRIIAIVGGSMDLLATDVLGGYVAQQFGKTGYMYVFDRRRLLLLHPERDRVLTSVGTGKNSLMEAALNGFDGVGETVNSKGVPMLLSMRHIPNTDWVACVQLPQKEAYAPIAEARTRIICISGLAIFLVTTIGAVAIRRVSSPLQQLKQVALQITAKLEELAATGVSRFPDSNLDRLANIRSRDEVGQLASSFLKLVNSLHSTLRSSHSTNLQLVQAKEAVEKDASYRKFQHFLICAIHEVSLDGILVVNNEGNVVSHNKRFFDVWQLPVTTVPDYLPDPDMSVSDQPVLSAVLERVKDPETFLRRVRELYDDPDASDHCEIELKDGRTLERYSTGLRGDSDEYLGRVWFFRDITVRKQAAQELHDSEEKFRQLAENIREAFWMMPPSADEILYVSPAYEEIWGRTCASLYQSPTSWVEAIHPDDLERVHSIFAQQIRGDPVESEYRIRTPDGQEKWIRNRTFPIRDQAGQLIRVAGIAEEITERKRYEAELVTTNQALNQAQKMEAVGRLAGGIAHDFNNLLMVIQSYTEMLQESLPARDARRKNTLQIMKAAKRAASLTGQMLAFSRKQIISPVVLDLNTVVNDTTKMLKRLIGEDIEFRIDPAESLWAAEADPDQIAQVLMNLCVNSRDAMPQGGTLTIATGNVTVEDGSTGIPPYVAPGEYVRLFVIDTGTGIIKKVQERVFEPFFTTKDVGKGTGLGLAMVYGVVKQSGGYVWVESELGQGTCFTIYLPRAKGAVAPDKSTKAEVRFQGTETLLVVEDEESLKEAICDYLKNLGYTVWAASSGPQAMLIASERGHIDLLITDVVMPKMSGRELSQMLRNQYHDLKTIHMSGYTDDAVLRQGIHELGTTLLQKPFSLSTLAGKVRDTLENAMVM